MVDDCTAGVLWDFASTTCSNIALSILVQLPSSFFSICLVRIDMVHPYSSMDMTAAWKKLHFILSDRSDFHMTDIYIYIHSDT